MKADKKQKKILPEVHVLGDLQDAKHLISVVNKKKRIIVFRDGELDTFYSDVKGEIKQLLQNEITKLEKDHRLVFFSFFPGRKVEEKKKVTKGKTITKGPESKIVAKKRVPGTAKVKIETKVK